MEQEDLNNSIERILELDCPSCGSKLYYSAEHQKLNCHHCGYKEDFNRDNSNLVENSLENALTSLVYYTPEKDGKSIYDCKGCAAKFSVDNDITRIVCAFCGSENVNLEAFDHKYIQPSGILPFIIPRKDAEDNFKKWIGKGWFHPNKLKKLAEVDSLHGVYIPFWTFDAMTKNQWVGEAGYYYYETVRVKIGDQWKTQQVRKVRWQWRSGRFEHFFDDVLVTASAMLNQQFLNRILPFQLDKAVNFDARLMVGWESEVYSVELNEGWQSGQKLISEQIRMMAMQALGGDTQRNLQVKTERSGETFKHIILPVWLASYRFNNKIYRFVINGQTGKVYGDKPISWLKIVLLILLFVLFIAAIYLLRESGILMGE